MSLGKEDVVPGTNMVGIEIEYRWATVDNDVVELLKAAMMELRLLNECCRLRILRTTRTPRRMASWIPLPLTTAIREQGHALRTACKLLSN